MKPLNLEKCIRLVLTCQEKCCRPVLLTTQTPITSGLMSTGDSNSMGKNLTEFLEQETSESYRNGYKVGGEDAINYKKLLSELVMMTEENEKKSMKNMQQSCMVIHPRSDFINRVRKAINDT